MITLKSGVPGSGKTLSMVAELLENSKAKEPRPVYTNITGLAIPHILMENWEPNTTRKENTLYTIDWRECPAGSLIVIDEAFLYGYDARSAQATVPDYIRDLAVHRKDFSVDIVFIAQHPKLLHVALRRQVGKHQHYRRLFGWGRAVCYEWDQAQDNLAQTKTAVMTQFSYPRSVFKAYKSAEVHTKPKFKLPWFAWIPVALIPLAAWALPNGYAAMHGAMTGKGVAQEKPAEKPPAPVQAKYPTMDPKDAATTILATAPKPSPPPQLPPFPVAQSAPAGCIVTPKGCGCFDTQGKPVEKDAAMCQALEKPAPVTDLAKIAEPTYYRPKVDVQMAALMFGVNKLQNSNR